MPPSITDTFAATKLATESVTDFWRRTRPVAANVSTANAVQTLVGGPSVPPKSSRDLAVPTANKNLSEILL